MKYHGMTVIVNNDQGAQRVGMDSISADLLVKHLALAGGVLAVTANAGDIIVITPYVQEVSWLRVLRIRFREWRNLRRAEKRLREQSL